MGCRAGEGEEEPHRHGSAGSIPTRMPVVRGTTIDAPNESGDIKGEEEAEEKEEEHDEHLS